MMYVVVGGGILLLAGGGFWILQCMRAGPGRSFTDVILEQIAEKRQELVEAEKYARVLRTRAATRPLYLQVAMTVQAANKFLDRLVKDPEDRNRVGMLFPLVSVLRDQCKQVSEACGPDVAQVPEDLLATLADSTAATRAAFEKKIADLSADERRTLRALSEVARDYAGPVGSLAEQLGVKQLVVEPEALHTDLDDEVQTY